MALTALRGTGRHARDHSVDVGVARRAFRQVLQPGRCRVEIKCLPLAGGVFHDRILLLARLERLPELRGSRGIVLGQLAANGAEQSLSDRAFGQ